MDQAATVDRIADHGPRRRPLWRLLNDARAFHPGAVRVCCIVLAAAFGTMVALRAIEGGQTGFLLPRGAMLAYAIVGVIVGPRLGWYGLRAYTVGLTLMLPLVASYVIGMGGYPPAQVTFCALGTFVPYIFLMCGWDFVIASALLLLGHAVVFQLVPESTTPRWILWGVQLGAMACGTASGVLLVTFRGLVTESRAWWQASHARERALREFAEVASAAMTGDAALVTLAAAFAGTVPGSACAFVIEGADGRLQLAAAAGGGLPETKRPGKVPPEAEAVASHAASVPLTHRDLPPGGPGALAAWLGVAFEPGGVVLLPLGGLVRGTIVLLVVAERDITPEALLMWAAMAHASAVTVANVHAWNQLRAQEAQARQLSDERVAIAEMRARFVTQASHEFRTPLAVILAAASTLERYGDRLTAAERQQKLARISTGVGHMTVLLDDVLALGQAEAQARTGVRHPTDLRALCDSALAEVQDTALASHQLALQCREASVLLAVDATLMRSVVSNLLTNAVKYSPAGGAVDLSLQRRDDAIVLRVRDQGIGIPEQDRDQLFESFRRATNVAAIPGSGLGLAIVQRGVEAHGGTIHIESTVGVGTTVEIVLPADGEPSGHSDASAARGGQP